MVKILLHTVWRLLVLGLGLLLAYVSFFVAFPFLDRQLPFLVAFVLVYILIAYFGIPWLFRFWRVVFKPNHIPLYATTRDGLPSDPVNIAVVAKSRHHLIRSMKKAGWYTADKATIKNSLREAWAVINDQPYPTAPFGALYLFNRHFDIGFQLPYGKNGSPRHRHHVRFWQLVEQQQEDHGHFSFWIRHFRRFVGKERTVWIGAATEDIHAMGIRWSNFQLTHGQHESHYRERDFIIQSLQDSGRIKRVEDIQAGKPFEIRGQSFGLSFVSDGKLRVIELKP
ncbi:LssY C-terminal domain-containing protein [Candidatus Saccharibacteria bacterium]|nr:LssY C-terminal domain-containing protein [Candidatus Saccharibacteria bacterium]